ncbi:MerR family transcriptional regulator [Crocinitomix catalasitica]|uniref:MerR family transcriptional regulator n=1 Tax=Crocinitomix catalasitica TaxID=184607 RepID=UPI000484D695|nr:MerR family transcriptional regulator [Crocinitomix catalasitica]
MNNIKTSFTIQDLELLSGVKAHTIRIWEKRYNLLNPERLNRKIRMYNINDLQKMLNVSYLYLQDYKISTLAKLSEKELAKEVEKVASAAISNNYEIHQLIISLYTFNDQLFEDIYKQQSKKMDFKEIFVGTYLPLLQHIGLLWQSSTIQPVHEHFISNLIHQKIVLNTVANSNKRKVEDDEVFVLFLPDGEIHETGLLFLNYLFQAKGCRTIYLGRDVPVDNLSRINSQFSKINWICYFLLEMTYPDKESLLVDFENLLSATNNKATILGGNWDEISSKNKQIKVVPAQDIHTFIKEI